MPRKKPRPLPLTVSPEEENEKDPAWRLVFHAERAAIIGTAREARAALSLVLPEFRALLATRQPTAPLRPAPPKRAPILYAQGWQMAASAHDPAAWTKIALLAAFTLDICDELELLRAENARLKGQLEDRH